MKTLFWSRVGGVWGHIAFLMLVSALTSSATDWPQYRGPTTDGVSPDPITWPAGGPTAGWTNMSLKNGFSSFVISRGRAFTLISQDPGSGRIEYCAAVDAATGNNIWTAPIGPAPGDDPSAVGGNGGSGTPPYNTGDGPRTTPAVEGGSVFVLSAHMVLVSLNWTNGTINWTKDLAALYGASEPGGCWNCLWNNAASPRLDNGLIFVNLNTAMDNNPLCAFSTTDGSRVWASPNNEDQSLIHATPVVATIQGVRQVIFATPTRLVSLDRDTGMYLWTFTYPFLTPLTMGASPVVYSNMVFCAAGYYGKGGSAAAQITQADGTWHVQQLYFFTDPNYFDPHYRNIWMTPVCYQGYIYTLCGNQDINFLTSPLNCIELRTGTLKWAVNGFGRGGMILVNTNLLVLTEDGQLVLVQPDPGGYNELARYRAFQFTTDVPGKCWNSPAYSNGRIYARSTTGGVAVDVSPPPSSPAIFAVGASNITTRSATLSGTVNPNGAATAAWFQWGLTSSYGSNTLAATNLTGTLPLTISSVLSGLAPATAYHFRLTATNSAGTTNGADLVFATSPLPPRLEFLPPQSLSSTQLRLLIGTTNGTPIVASRLSNIVVRASSVLAGSPLTWPKLTNALVLTTDGLVILTNVISGGQTQLFYITIEQP
jgi:outer membrane protein assembly factor BamB